MTTGVAETSFRCMGCTMRLLAGPASAVDGASPDEALARERSWLEAFDARLSRFRPESELSRLNADPREVVPVSGLLRAVLAAGLWAAERTGGLVDPTLIDEVEAAGYRRSLGGIPPVPLSEALPQAPPRRPAAPRADGVWQSFRIDHDAGSVERPPGARFDPGGVGKGLAADAVAHHLADRERWAVDCAGDLRVGGREAGREPFAIEVEHPLTRDVAHVLRVGQGAVATSALSSRIWRADDGGYAHHLLDPATGRPAWTGVISATALAPTALEAETLAKAALLSGPDAGRARLEQLGGVLVLDDGRVKVIGPPARPVVRLPRP